YLRRDCQEAQGLAQGLMPARWRLKYPAWQISWYSISGSYGSFMRLFVVLLLTSLFAAVVHVEGVSGAPPKVALVIGTARYPGHDIPMNDATNDAQDVAEELRRDGFAVERGMDLTADAMRQALSRFYAKIQPGSVALLFFDGFGIQSARQTFLL